MLVEVDISAEGTADYDLDCRDTDVQLDFDAQWMDWGPVRPMIPLGTGCELGPVAHSSRLVDEQNLLAGVESKDHNLGTVGTAADTAAGVLEARDTEHRKYCFGYAN